MLQFADKNQRIDNLRGLLLLNQYSLYSYNEIEEIVTYARYVVQ